MNGCTVKSTPQLRSKGGITAFTSDRVDLENIFWCVCGGSYLMGKWTDRIISYPQEGKETWLYSGIYDVITMKLDQTGQMPWARDCFLLPIHFT